MEMCNIDINTLFNMEMCNIDINTLFNIEYDENNNKIFINHTFFIAYLKLLCDTICDTICDNNDSILCFLDNIYYNHISWNCKICNKQLIKHDMYTNYIYYHKDSCINYIDIYNNNIYNNTTSRIIRGLLCKKCNTNENTLAHLIALKANYKTLHLIPNYNNIINFWETSGYYHTIPMDTRLDK